MEDINILNKGIEALYEIKKDLEKADELRRCCVKTDDEEKQVEREISFIKKNCVGEIKNKVSSERNKMIILFQEEQNRLKYKLNEVQQNRKNEKKNKVNKKIELRTGNLWAEVKSKEENIKSIYSNCDTPRILNNSLCNSIFLPQSFADYMMLIMVILGILAIPLIICPFVFDKILPLSSKKPFVIAAVLLFVYICGYIVLNSSGRMRLFKMVDSLLDLFAIHIPHMILPFLCLSGVVTLLLVPEEQQRGPLFFLVYVILIKIMWRVYKGIKNKWYKVETEAIQKAKNQRNQIKVLKKLIKKEKQIIKGEKDESEYGLEDYDLEIKNIQQQINKNIEDNRTKLAVFDNETKKEIEKEINDKYSVQLRVAEIKLEVASDKKQVVNDEYNKISHKILNEYSPYLGNENLSLTRIGSLIQIIENGKAENIASAIDVYKNTIVQEVKQTQGCR